MIYTKKSSFDYLNSIIFFSTFVLYLRLFVENTSLPPHTITREFCPSKKKRSMSLASKRELERHLSL